MYLETTNSSATLERAGVRDIGRKCLQISITGFDFMIGSISAVFHGVGSCCSLKLLLRTLSFTISGGAARRNKWLQKHGGFSPLLTPDPRHMVPPAKGIYH